MLLDGLHIPLTTPFRRDGSIDTAALTANVLRYSHAPAAGLIVLGPAGEPTLLDDNETRTVLRTVAAGAAPEKVLIANVSRDSVAATLDLANYAAEQQYDVVVAGVPGVLGLQQELELLTFFRAVADHSPLPLVVQSTARRPIRTETLQQLALHDNILGLFAADRIGLPELLTTIPAATRQVTVTHVFSAVTRRMQRGAAGSLISPGSLTQTAVLDPSPAQPPLRTRTKAVGFQIIAMHAAALLDGLNEGAVGIAPSFAAAAPQATYEIYAAWKDAAQNHESGQALATEKQQRIVEAAELIQRLGPGGLKFATDLNGYAGGLPRLPHLPPTGEQREKLQQLMKPLHN